MGALQLDAQEVVDSIPASWSATRHTETGERWMLAHHHSAGRWEDAAGKARTAGEILHDDKYADGSAYWTETALEAVVLAAALRELGYAAERIIDPFSDGPDYVVVTTQPFDATTSGDDPPADNVVTVQPTPPLTTLAPTLELAIQDAATVILGTPGPNHLGTPVVGSGRVAVAIAQRLAEAGLIRWAGNSKDDVDAGPVPPWGRN